MKIHSDPPILYYGFENLRIINIALVSMIPYLIQLIYLSFKKDSDFEEEKKTQQVTNTFYTFDYFIHFPTLTEGSK